MLTFKRLRTLIVLASSMAGLGTVAATAEAAKSKRLKAFRSCSSLIGYGNRYAAREAVPLWRFTRPAPAPVGGMQGGGSDGGGAEGGGSAPASGQDESAAAAPAPAAGTDFSGTNNQEKSVDEPDIVKTDGSTVFALVDGKLRAVDVRNGSAKLAGTLNLPGNPYGGELLISGKRALVMWTTGGGYSGPMAGAGDARAASSPVPSGIDQKTVLAEVDISDIAAMKISRMLELDGRLVSSRLNGSTARVIAAATPRALAVPVDAGAGVAEQRRSFARAGSARAKRWIPRGVTRRGTKGKRRGKAAVACRAVRRPSVFSGLDMVTILTIDLDKGLTPVDSDALMTDAETVYASRDSLYIATRKWIRAVDSPLPVSGTPEPPTIRTQVHKFDISDSQNTTYKGTGDVSGFLLNQFSMSEHKGVLRVASTDGPEWWPGPTGASESMVTTLGEAGAGLLAPLGRVAGLGKGERIYAVRFIGDTGYVVTFRQTDPLYTIDASDPAKPRVVGELKILGYSAYLHPAGDGLLIGVGQDATEEGRRTGAQVSLFDVSDPAAPKRLHQFSLGRHASTEAEYDHHAFLYWPATSLLMLPVERYEEASSFAGAVGLRVRADSGISQIAEVTHDGEDRWRILRSMVIGERVFTLSGLGLKASALDTLADSGFVRFPR